MPRLMAGRFPTGKRALRLSGRMNDLFRTPQRSDPRTRQRKPDWIRVKAPTSKGYGETRELMRDLGLNTVCEEAACPNIGECWTKKHATVMILGDTCTRACAFCNVKTGMPKRSIRLSRHVAVAAAKLGLEHIVITSVDRDDLPDGGAGQFVKVIEALRRNTPDTTIEILTPISRQDARRLRRSSLAGPDVYNHNLETVPRLYPTIRRARAIMPRCAAREVKRHNPRSSPSPGSCWGWARAAGSPSGDGRHALRRHRFPDHGPVPAAHPKARQSGGIRHARRPSMPMARSRGQRAFLQVASHPADPFKLSRRRRFRGNARRAAGQAGQGSRR
jgi:hypothetical protein